MPPRIDLAGLRFGRLLVISFSHVDMHGNAHWHCRCDCTKKRLAVNGADLRSRHVQSCGCLNSELTRQRRITHGHAPTGKPSPEYRVWTAMIHRCENKKSTDYPEYGGRGIMICQDWRNSFEAFLADMGRKPPGKTKNGLALYSIDRINNDLGYFSANCRWATWTEQANNQRQKRKQTRPPQEKPPKR